MHQVKKIIFQIIGVNSYSKLGMIKQHIMIFMLKICKSLHLASIYYALFSRSFNHEHHKIISGLLKNKTDSENIGNFRRNIHRIEKGIVTIERKPVFAESYINETVQILKNIINKPCDKQMLVWAYVALDQYFSIVQETSEIIKARNTFLTINRPEIKNLPGTYFASERIKSNIKFDDFFNLNLQRRAIRCYQNKSVPRDLIERAVELALNAPSACNRQPFMFRIIDDPLLVGEAAKLPMGAETFANNIKMMIFIIGDLSNYFDERDKHLIYIDASLMAMNFILALETLGLSSCIINWSDIIANNNRLKSFLDLKDWEQCVMSISVGYADPNGKITASMKKEVKSVIKYNQT